MVADLQEWGGGEGPGLHLLGVWVQSCLRREGPRLGSPRRFWWIGAFGGLVCCWSDVGMVRLRLKRMGRRHRPFYRLNAVDKRTQRDGKVLEQLGWYDPMSKDEAKQVHLNADRP